MGKSIFKRRVDHRTFFDIERFFTCQVRILIVTDSDSGGFGTVEGFHLGQILRILAEDPWFHVRFVVTKAHRQSAADTDINNFRFHTHDLSQYDQIWLFGIYREGPDPLSQPELKALAQFMDGIGADGTPDPRGGGGVFATGDHENLGQAMCAEVPRVRSMRRWYHNGSGPAGEPEAPDQFGAGRHDTLVDPPGLPVGDQSDALPQRIRPKFYHRTLSGGIVRRVAKYPHPVLCGAAGVIDFLPDHMHEGLCEVPSNLTRSYTFDGYTTTEYPTGADGQEIPEVIAKADSHGTNTPEFGVLAAYNGHSVGVGRVVVDATWHHWFNINLAGFLDATNPASPSYDSLAVPKWEEIKAYFRNVALWLARKGMQTCLKNSGWLIVTRYYDVIITHRDLSRVKNPLLYYWQLGVFARDAFGHIASQCQTIEYFFTDLEVMPIRINPWWQPPRPPWPPDPPFGFNTEELELVALGGAVDSIITRFGREKEFETLVEQQGAEIKAVANKGAATAISLMVQQIQESTKNFEGLIKQATDKLGR